MRVFNFGAGPSTIPVAVLERAQKEMLDYAGSGMGPMEFSHRSPLYDDINDGAQALLRELMGIDDNYYILFLQGGASTQFEAVPLNLLGKNNKADYVLTGHWAKSAFDRAKKYGQLRVAGDSADKKYTYTPDYDVDKDAAYLHITTNNTIYGTRFSKPVVSDIPVVADMSSNILSEPYDVNKYGVIYAGAQKNMSCAGIAVIIVRKDLVDNDYTMPICPKMLSWKTHADKNSLFNTPPTYTVYILKLMLEWLKNFGGIEAMHKQNLYQAKLLYDFIDNSSLFVNPVNPADRSIMNVIFTTGNDEIDAKFVKESKENGLLYLKGHKSVGGLRASIYNAMTNEGVETLVEFMKKFELANK